MVYFHGTKGRIDNDDIIEAFADEIELRIRRFTSKKVTNHTESD